MTNLAALLFDVARRLPDRPAVSDDRSSRTYPELAERVARLAGGLREQGLAPGGWVLLSLENCGEFVELLFGCWTAGLCAVPANARLHPREVEFIAEMRTSVFPAQALSNAAALHGSPRRWRWQSSVAPSSPADCARLLTAAASG